MIYLPNWEHLAKKTTLEKEPKMVAERVLFASFLSSQHKAFVLRDHKPKSGHVYL